MIYLDHAATTPVPKAVADTVYEALMAFANPSAQYPMGQEQKRTVESHRATVAKALACAPECVHFTSCGTESDNWAIMGALHHGRHVGKHIITTAVEHSAILETCKALQQQGYEVTYLKPDKTGHVTAQQVADALREDTVLVSVMLVNNETGCIFPLSDIARVMKERGSRALLHTDAVQGFLKVPSAPAQLGVDLMSLSGHKIGAPKGIGALYIAPHLKNFRPLLFGGGQEMSRRSGTEATAQIAGFAKAVALRCEDLESSWQHMADIKAYCREKLLAMDGIVAVGAGEAPHILSVSMVGYPSANVVTDLGAQGICLSAGSACHRGKLSHVVQALGLDKRTAGGVLRLSFGPETTFEEIDAVCAALAKHKASRFPML
ncbi:MAG: cysteine desulfurase [Oscillospiraceae bacterium]|nr:cysteine desulfurase [Oscillospiraceae bacterium]